MRDSIGGLQNPRRQGDGAAGVRDVGLLESALARARHLFAYGERDRFVLATAYASGITRNHPFVDGNKRTAFMAASVFLGANGQDLGADEVEAVRWMLGLTEQRLGLVRRLAKGQLRVAIAPPAEASQTKQTANRPAAVQV